MGRKPTGRPPGRPPKVGGTLEEQAARIIRTAKRHEAEGEIAAIAKTLSEEGEVQVSKTSKRQGRLRDGARKRKENSAKPLSGSVEP